MVRARSKKTGGYERLLAEARRQGLSSRTPWRHRQKRRAAQRKLTPAEKLARRKKRQDDNEQYRTMINDIQQIILEKAEAVREVTGKHSVNHIIQDVLQTYKMNGNQRKAGLFNAFVSLEMERINSGEFHLMFFTSVHNSLL